VLEQPNPIWLLPIELAVLLGCAVAPLVWPLPLPLPVVVPLIAAASLSLAVRRAALTAGAVAGGTEWFGIGIGAGAGLAALALAVLIATPLLSGGGVVVQWTTFPTVRGSVGQLHHHAAAEALVGPGPLLSRLGMALFGVALGMLYWRAGRRIGPPLAARLAFGLGALILQWLQLVD
jgi:hypothetical protein